MPGPPSPAIAVFGGINADVILVDRCCSERCRKARIFAAIMATGAPVIVALNLNSKVSTLTIEFVLPGINVSYWVAWFS
jgi:hypothetical protein